MCSNNAFLEPAYLRITQDRRRHKKVAAAGRLRLWHKIPPSDPNPSSRPLSTLEFMDFFIPLKPGVVNGRTNSRFFGGKRRAKKVVVVFQGYFDVPRPPFWEKDFFPSATFLGGI